MEKKFVEYIFQFNFYVNVSFNFWCENKCICTNVHTYRLLRINKIILCYRGYHQVFTSRSFHRVKKANMLA